MKFKFLPYNEATLFVHKLNLKGQNDWREYCLSGSKPHNIPSQPSVTYKNKGWINWMNWIGTNNHIGRSRTYNINDNYFNQWSSNMSYILGFWWADGFIYKNKFFITQHKKDKYILDKIIEEMKSDYIARPNKRDNTLTLEISSKKIVNDIIKLGGKYKKSKTCTFPFVPSEFLKDFIRGYFDGDGCITFGSGKRFYTSSFTSGSIGFIKGLHKCLNKNIPETKGTIHKTVAKRGVVINGWKTKRPTETYTLYFGVNDTRRLRDFIYKDSPCFKLERKFKRFIKAGNICPSPSNKVFLKYKEAKDYINQLKIKNCREWKTYASSKRPSNIPSNPSNFYKNKGWEGWFQWLNN
jgi:hypothetical protein